MRSLANTLRHLVSRSPADRLWTDRAFFGVGGIATDELAELPHIDPLPAGWMNASDLRVLYNVALHATGPFLEIGPWIGRSTSALCAGIRDAGQPRKMLDVIDFGICGVDEWKRRFGYVPDFSLSTNLRGQVGASITAPGGTLAVLIENLRLNGLLEFTTSICRGDWIECPHGRKYGFVFIDAVHDENEARRHLPRLRTFLLPRALAIMDDVVDQDFARLVCGLLGSKEFVLTRWIGNDNKLMVTRLPR